MTGIVRVKEAAEIHCGCLVGLVVSKAHACYPAGRCWLGLGSNPDGVEFQWQCRWHILPCLVSDWLAGGLSEQVQPTTR